MSPVPTPPSESVHIVIAGGGGFLGTSLAAHLAGAGASVSILSRARQRQDLPPTPPPGLPGAGAIRFLHWDARTPGPWAAALEGAAALVNLTGRSVDCIKSPDHCDEILRSRVESTRVLGFAVRSATKSPPIWVQMSTAHIYGDPPEAACDEESPLGYGLAPTVGRAWEEEFDRACPPSVRRVVLRTSFVIGRPNRGGAGALGTLGLLARLGLGGRAGHGRQWMSWLHETDLNRLIEQAISDPSMHGVYVASAPNPVRNAEFMRQLRRAVRAPKVPLGLPAFSWMVRLGAPLVLRTDPELALYGRHVTSRRLAVEGFAFRFPTLREALADLYGR